MPKVAMLKFDLGHYQIVTRRFAEFSAQKAAREAHENEQALARTRLRLSRRLSWMRPGALIFWTEPMDLEAEAAALADELLARVVADHNAWRAWRRRGFALGWHIARVLGFRR